MSQSSTPYDDVFRTILNDCRGLIPPLLNEIFSESYTGTEAIYFGKNEHLMNRQRGEGEKRITDSICFAMRAFFQKWKKMREKGRLCEMPFAICADSWKS